MSYQMRTILVCLVVGIVAAGCGSTRLTPLMTLERPLTEKKAVYFAAEAAVAEDVADQVSQLEEKVLKQLNKEKLFQTVMLGQCKDSCTNAVNVKATITEIRKMGGFARFMIGMFAGKATMTSEVSFVEGASGVVLGKYTVDVDDGGQGDTGSQVSRTSKAIVKLIKANGI